MTPKIKNIDGVLHTLAYQTHVLNKDLIIVGLNDNNIPFKVQEVETDGHKTFEFWIDSEYYNRALRVIESVLFMVKEFLSIDGNDFVKVYLSWHNGYADDVYSWLQRNGMRTAQLCKTDKTGDNTAKVYVPIENEKEGRELVSSYIANQL